MAKGLEGKGATGEPCGLGEALGPDIEDNKLPVCQLTRYTLSTSAADYPPRRASLSSLVSTSSFCRGEVD